MEEEEGGEGGRRERRGKNHQGLTSEVRVL